MESGVSRKIFLIAIDASLCVTKERTSLVETTGKLAFAWKVPDELQLEGTKDELQILAITKWTCRTTQSLC